MSKIVADADGLIMLGKSGALGHLLSAAEIVVPRSVYREAVEAGKKEMYEDAFELEKVLGEGGAERLVPLHDRVETAREDGDIEPADQPNDGSKMIGSAARLQLVQKPEPLLGK